MAINGAARSPGLLAAAEAVLCHPAKRTEITGDDPQSLEMVHACDDPDRHWTRT
jgi:hypothetical protein